MKHQALLSSNDISKRLKCRLLQFLFGAIRVNKGYRVICLRKQTVTKIISLCKTGEIPDGVPICISEILPHISL